MRKQLCILLAAFLSASSFVGCGDDGSQSFTDYAVIRKSDGEATVFSFEKPEDMKIGFVYTGKIDDEGFTSQMDKARLELTELGYACAYSEDTPDNELCVNEISRLIEEEGCNIIVLSSYNYFNYAKKASLEYPNVAFIQYSEEGNTDSVGTYFFDTYELRYFMGIAAGLKAKELDCPDIGYVASVQVPILTREINAFTLGVKSVYKDAVVHLNWTNAWGNETEERRCAQSLIDKYGCKVMSFSADTQVVAKVCEENKVYVAGMYDGVKTAAPNFYLTAGKIDFAKHIKKEIESFTNGGWKASQTEYDMTSAFFMEINDISLKNCAEHTMASITLARNKICSKELYVFSGEIKDNAGFLRVESGKNLSEAEISDMNWLIEGIVEE